MQICFWVHLLQSLPNHTILLRTPTSKCFPGRPLNHKRKRPMNLNIMFQEKIKHPLILVTWGMITFFNREIWRSREVVFLLSMCEGANIVIRWEHDRMAEMKVISGFSLKTRWRLFYRDNGIRFYTQSCSFCSMFSLFSLFLLSPSPYSHSLSSHLSSPCLFSLYLTLSSVSLTISQSLLSPLLFLSISTSSLSHHFPVFPLNRCQYQSLAQCGTLTWELFLFLKVSWDWIDTLYWINWIKMR